MDPETDHYKVLGLPSGEEGLRVSQKEIARAFKRRALELHPDKRPDDPNAKHKFQKLNDSYEVLKDDVLRRRYDDLVRIKIVYQQEAARRRRARKMAASDRRAAKKNGAPPAASQEGGKRRKAAAEEEGGASCSSLLEEAYKVVLRDRSNCPCCAERRRGAEEGREWDFVY